jgi:RNA polymerase-binding transcription factor DksA
VTITRDLLLAQRGHAKGRAAALEREFTAIAEAASGPGTDDEHDPEGATLAFERQHTAALLAQALDQVAEIDAAIARLDDGTYGVCVRCGQPIGQERLAARPVAAACVRCARLLASPPGVSTTFQGTRGFTAGSRGLRPGPRTGGPVAPPSPVWRAGRLA